MRIERLPTANLNGFNSGGFEVFKNEVLVIVLRFDSNHGLDSFAARDLIAGHEFLLFKSVALQEGRHRSELVVLTTDENFVAGGLNRFFQTEERTFDRKVDRRVTRFALDAN